MVKPILNMFGKGAFVFFSNIYLKKKFTKQVVLKCVKKY